MMDDNTYMPVGRSQQQRRVQLACLFVALLLPLLLFITYHEILSIPVDDPVQATPIQPPGKGQTMLEIKVDSFKALLSKAYRTGTHITTQGSILTIEVNGQGTQSPLFYNANPNVLGKASDDFTIEEDKLRQSIRATCKIHDSIHIQYIKVPADILFKLTDLASN